MSHATLFLYCHASTLALHTSLISHMHCGCHKVDIREGRVHLRRVEVKARCVAEHILRRAVRVCL